MSLDNNISNKKRRFEIFAVILTGIGKILIVNVIDKKFIFILTATIFWIVYTVYNIIRSKELVSYWGLSFKSAKKPFKIVGPVAAVITILFIVYGIFFDTIRMSWGFLIIMLTYPVWGLIQQFLTMSLFAGNLKDFTNLHLKNSFIIFLTTVLFSIVHLPLLPLFVATFFMALFYSVVFLKYRNILALGIFHGILGGLFFYFVLNKDPWLEFLEFIASN